MPQTEVDQLRRRLAGLEREVSERCRAELDLRTRQEDLLRANAELKQFAYAVSHDLEEPLRTVLMFSQMMRDRELHPNAPECREILTHIIRGGELMAERIRGLLAFATADTAPAWRLVDLNEVIDQLRVELRAAMKESRAELIVEPLPLVMGDRTKLIQVFQNLITNALKHRHPERPARVTVRSTREHHFWNISVEDNGIGFTSTQARRIFDLFYRLHTTPVPGAGVGLAITKRIIEQHGGGIWAEGRPGEGATFRFRLPIRPLQGRCRSHYQI